MELSKRLQTIADMVTSGNRTADIGCDHGFVSIYLYQSGIAPKVYAMDVRMGPLARATEHIEERGLSAYIETRLSDGLAALREGEAETIICAGMGGRLMEKILQEGLTKVMAAKELILQPQSEIAGFRAFLRTHGLQIVKEDIVKEEGKFYPVIKAVPVGDGQVKTLTDTDGEESVSVGNAVPEGRMSMQAGSAGLQRIQDAFGPLLLAAKHPVLLEYLYVLQKRNRDILEGLGMQCAKGNLSEKSAVRRKEVEEELACIEQGIALCTVKEDSSYEMQ